MTEKMMNKTRKVAIAAILAVGLTGAATAAGISVASSDPGSNHTTTPVDGNDITSMDTFDSAQCERHAEQNGETDHSDMDLMMGDMFDRMGSGDQMNDPGFMNGGSGADNRAGMGSMGS